eukprot:g4106.t1
MSTRCQTGLFRDMSVWHFFTKKWIQKELTVPLTAPNYWQKRWVTDKVIHVESPLGYFLTKLRGTWLCRVLPLDHIVIFHKYLGYVVGLQLLATFVVFLGHFGKLCRDAGEEGRCARKRS